MSEPSPAARGARGPREAALRLVVAACVTVGLSLGLTSCRGGSSSGTTAPTKPAAVTPTRTPTLTTVRLTASWSPRTAS